MIKDNLTITVYDVMIKDNCYQKRIAIMPMQWIPRTVHGWLVSPDDDDEYVFVCLLVSLFGEYECVCSTVKEDSSLPNVQVCRHEEGDAEKPPHTCTYTCIPSGYYPHN